MPGGTPVSPVLLLAGPDPVLRDTAAANLLVDLPGAVAVRYDRAPDCALVRALVHAPATEPAVPGAVSHPRDPAVTLPDTDAGVTDAVRRDLLSALRRATATFPPAVLVVLPGQAEPLPLLRAAVDAGPALVAAGATLAGLALALSADTLERDLFAARPAEGTVPAAGDGLTRWLDLADAVLMAGRVRDREHRLLRHLCSADLRVAGLHGGGIRELVSIRRPRDDGRGDLRRVEATGWPDGDGVWTVELRSWRPLHPERLLAALPALAGAGMRGRGHFWLPTRPTSTVGWDGTGPRLALTPLGRRDGGPGGPLATRLVVTGVDLAPATVRTAFARALTTDAELARGLDWWAARGDGFGRWLT